MKNQVSITPLDITGAFEARDELREQMELMIKVAQDEKRDMTKSEAATFKALRDLRDRWDEVGIRMAEGAAGNFDAAGLLAGNRTGRGRTQNIWGDTMRDMAGGKVANVQTRGLTTSNSSAAIQDPLIMDQYVASLSVANPLTSLGVMWEVDHSNYSQWPAASGEPAVSYINELGTITPDTSWAIKGQKATFATMVCLIKVSRQMAMDQMQTGAFVQQELNTAFGNRIIADFMQGTGSGQPTGMDNLAGINTVDLAGSAFAWDDYVSWTSTLVANRVDPARISWIGGASNLAYVNNLLDSTNQPRQKPPVLDDQQFFWTSAVSEAYASTRTRIYGGDFSTARIVFRQSVGQEMPGFGGMIYLDQLYAESFEVGFLAYVNYDTVWHRPTSLIRIDGVPLT